MRRTIALRIGLVAACLAGFAPRADAAPNPLCHELIAQARNDARDVVAGIGLPERTSYGVLNEVRWLSPRMNNALPVFLVLEAPEHVRFQGKTVNAFVRGAQQRFGLTGDGRQVAAVVPLHRLTGGTIGLKFYRAGTNTLSWHVRTGRECGYQVLRKPAALNIEVSPGAPEVLVQDRFAVGQPATRTRSNDGRYELLTFKSHYEVYDIASGARILRREGFNPNFSPTARFVAANEATRDGIMDGTYEIVDLVSGEKIYQAMSGFLAWLRDDSILLNGTGLYPTVNILQMLIDDREFGMLSGSKPPITIHSEIQVIVNLEKGVVVRRYPDAQDHTAAIDDLTSGESKMLGEGRTAVSLNEINSALGVFGGQLETLPDAWTIGETLKLSHDNYHYSWLKYPLDRIPDRFKPLGSWKGAHFVRHQKVAAQTAHVAQNTDPLAGRTVSGRALSVDVPRQTKPGDVIVRQEDLGVRFDPTSTVATDSRPRDNRADVTKRTASYDRRLSALFSGFSGKFIDGGYDRRTEGHLLLKDVADRWNISDSKVLLREQRYEGSARGAYGGLWLADQKARQIVNISAFVHADSTSGENTNPNDPYAPENFFSSEENARFVVRTASNGDVLFASADHRFAAIFDPTTRKRVGPVHDLPNGTLVSDLRLSNDKRFLFQFNSDGAFHIHKAAVGGIVLSGYFVDNEIVVYRPDGLFDATYEGAQSVQLRFPGVPGVHGFAQFASLLKRDNLLKDVLADNAIAGAPALPGAPPEVAIKLEAVTNIVAARIDARSAAGLKSVRLYVDGMLAKELPVTGEQATLRHELTDPGAGRPVAAVAVDRHGILSLPSIASVPGRAGPKGRLFGLAIGVDQYDDPKILPLSGAKKDANALISALKAAGPRAYSEVRMATLTDSDATPEAILSALEAIIAEAGPQDTVLLFFAGHGINANEIGFRLVTKGSRIADLAGTSLASADLGSLIATARARVILLLDACQSGSAGSGFRASNDALASQLVTGSGAPVLVLAAAKGREDSLEHPNGAGGLFTTALTSIITTERDKHDRNRNGLLEAGEIYLAVKEHVVAQSTRMAEEHEKRNPNAPEDKKLRPHTPWLERNAMIGDFPLF